MSDKRKLQKHAPRSKKPAQRTEPSKLRLTLKALGGIPPEAVRGFEAMFVDEPREQWPEKARWILRRLSEALRYERIEGNVADWRISAGLDRMQDFVNWARHAATAEDQKAIGAVIDAFEAARDGVRTRYEKTDRRNLIIAFALDHIDAAWTADPGFGIPLMPHFIALENTLKFAAAVSAQMSARLERERERVSVLFSNGRPKRSRVILELTSILTERRARSHDRDIIAAFERWSAMRGPFSFPDLSEPLQDYR